MQNTPPIQNQTQPALTPQPTNTPPTTTISQQPTAKKKKPWILISLIVLLLGVTGAFAYKYYEVKQQLDNQPSTPLPSPKLVINSPSPVASPTLEVDSTANWETYKNDDFNFQLSYPQEWNFKLGYGGGFLFQASLKKEDSSQQPVGMPGGTTITPYYQVLISIQNNSENLSAKDFYLNNFTSEARSDAEKKLEEIKIANGYAIKYQEAISPSSGLATTVLVSHDSKIYQLSYGAIAYEATHEKYLAIFNSILSTFQFTDK